MSDALIEAGSAFLAAYNHVKDLERKLKDAKKELDKEEEILLDQFAQSDAQTIVIADGDGAKTLSPTRDLMPTIKSEHKEDAILVFKANGLDDLVVETVQPGRLKSWVKEQEVNEQDMPIIPEPLDEMINIFEKFSISCRNAPRKKKPKTQE